MRIAIAQMRSTDDPWENLLIVNDLVSTAEENDCDLICFPENVFYRGPRQPQILSRQDLALENSFEKMLQANDWNQSVAHFFQDRKVAISLGSVMEKSSDPQRPYNSHWFIKPGANPLSYHKINLFNFEAGQVSYRESDDFTAGTSIVSVEWKGWKIGLSICYDLRFPELYRQLVLKENCELLLIPAAFTYQTGLVHWHTLLKARAIENLSYVVAAAQWGDHCNYKGEALSCYGHTLSIDPWGTIIFEGSEKGDDFTIVELQKNQINHYRKILPALSRPQKVPR
jgi:predicted amidohydrolase